MWIIAPSICAACIGIVCQFSLEPPPEALPSTTSSGTSWGLVIAVAMVGAFLTYTFLEVHTAPRDHGRVILT